METKTGPEVLTELVDAIRETDAEADSRALAEHIWPAFCAAVGAAYGELKAREMEGVARWRAENNRLKAERAKERPGGEGTS